MTSPLTRPACQTCADAGTVFDCPLWPGCDCPGGTTRNGCPGHSKPCPDCVQARTDSGLPLTNKKCAHPAQPASASDTVVPAELKGGGH